MAQPPQDHNDNSSKSIRGNKISSVSKKALDRPAPEMTKPRKLRSPRVDLAALLLIIVAQEAKSYAIYPKLRSKAWLGRADSRSHIFDIPSINHHQIIRATRSEQKTDPTSIENDDESILVEENRSTRGLAYLPSTLFGGGPPLKVDNVDLLLFDIFLLLTLTTGIDFLVVHRMSVFHISEGLNEGALICICWILCGLANGAFLASAIDGHYNPNADADKSGPGAAGLLGLSTFISTCSLRLMIALALAVLQHRQVGLGGEALMPLEIPFGLALMSIWRAAHSAYTPRI